MEEVRWGLIGCGQVTEKKSGPGFQKARNSTLVAVMDRNEWKARDYAERHNVPKWYHESDNLIHDPEVDAVYIATPPSSHKEYALAVAEVGKVVYVEKPMALNHEECLEIIEACKVTDTPLFVAYYRRALPCFHKIKTMLEYGEIGVVRYVSTTFSQHPSELDIKGVYQWRNDPEISGCGKFCEMCCHMLDLLQFYFGPIGSTNGYATNQADFYEVPDMVSSNFMFESGVHGVGTWNFTSYEDVDRTEIVGDEGKITYSTFLDAPIILEKEGMKEEFFLANPEYIQQPLIQTIVDELLGRGNCPSTGRTAAKTNWVIDQILEGNK
ncbi:MAG: Gfo/Idh/MocA family oxidoreductase [Anaerolineales bacterium]|nr:Gfo/Idh/MocA family oxidoreductase [Anaerolineales bacterium]